MHARVKYTKSDGATNFDGSVATRMIDFIFELMLFIRLGLEAFEVMYNASCLADPTTNAFCFLNAVANSDPTELYFYELPLGIALPVNAHPQCTPCTKTVLDAYAAALSDPTQADSLTGLKQTYDTAAGLTIQSCGSAYATTVTNGMVALRPKCLASVIGVMLLMGYILLLSN